MKQPNRVKAAMREGRIAKGYNVTFPSVEIIEILGPLNFDYVWIDGEHGTFSLEDLEHHCRTAESVGITPLARVPNIQSSTILQYLDRGIQGITGPHVACRADAEQLVKACLFGPAGERSFGGTRGCDYDFELNDKAAYLQHCNDDMLVGALLEDAGVVENLDEIVQVEGIDYFSIGPNDFAQGLGFPGGADRREVVDTMEEVFSRIKQAGRCIQRDIMHATYVKSFLLDSAQRFLSS